MRSEILLALMLLVGAGGLVGCDADDEKVPDLLTKKDPVAVHATPGVATPKPGDTDVVELPPELVKEAPPPPWPVLKIVAGAYSVDFAEEYVTALQAERAAFDAEMAQPREPPKTIAEAKHREIKDRGRRERLMNKPGLETITDEQISDFLSFNPELKSAAIEWPRLLAAHPDALGICVDHARWLNFREQRQATLAEYARCMKTPGITEDQLRYVTTQMAAVKQSPMKQTPKK